MLWRFIFALFVTITLAAQSGRAQDWVTQLSYPPLARQAQIQGDVQVTILNGNVVAKTGHPVLAAFGERTWKDFFTRVPENGVVMIHFALEDGPDVRRVIKQMPRSDVFGRFWLRLFRLRTTQDVEEIICLERPLKSPPASRFNEQGIPVEVWVYAPAICPYYVG